MKKVEKALQLFILLLFILYSQFYKLDDLAYRIWDEARLATSAFEMTETGNLFVTTIGYQPDMWNTKPPLMIWAQALAIKLFGLNEFATRLPAALCAALTVLLVFFFVRHITRSGYTALLAGIVLCTAHGYLDWHGSRYGEFDSMLTFFTTCYLFCFFMYVESRDRPAGNYYLLFFFFFLSLGILTKGIAALLFAPGLFLYLILQRGLVSTLKNRYFYIGAGQLLITVLGYYFIRESQNPGYLQAVYDNELGGRFLTPVEAHAGPPDFYISLLRWSRFSNWIWGVYMAALLFIFHQNPREKRLMMYSLISACLFLVVISASQTKINWYDLPVYPLLAVCVAMAVHSMAYLMQHLFTFLSRAAVMVVLMTVFSLQPAYEAFQQIRFIRDDASDSLYSISYYLRHAADTRKDLRGVIFLCPGYDLHWTLYVKRINRELAYNMSVTHLYEVQSFPAGSRVLAHYPELKSYVENNYLFELEEKTNDICLYRIKGKRPDTL